MKLLLGVSGSVAAIKIQDIITRLQEEDGSIEIKVVATERSLHFFKPEYLNAEVLTDKTEWQSWHKIGDSILHIELCKWADVFLIAPLDANTMGKISSGICDNLLTSIARAWRPEKPLLFAPAMNTVMWEHPVTSEHLNRLESYRFKCIPPVAKKLACGDDGVGAMAHVKDIVSAVIRKDSPNL